MTNNKLGIDFRDNISQVSHAETEASSGFNGNDDLLKNIVSVAMRKNSQAIRKIKSSTKSDASGKIQLFDYTDFFYISNRLLNLLRNPAILENHEFQSMYLQNVAKAFFDIKGQYTKQSHQIILYLHLILAQIENLDDLQELQAEEVGFREISSEWNFTNVMNSKCILKNIKEYLPDKKDYLLFDNQKKPKGLKIILLKKQNILHLDEEYNMQISHNYLELALKSNGHLDIYFAPLFVSKFSCDATLWFFNHFQDVEEVNKSYGKIFIQIAEENQHVSQIKFADWYKQQVKKIVEGSFHIEDIQHLLNFSSRNENQYLEKLLIALTGWKTYSDEAIKLLNVFYDNCDWQANFQHHPIIDQAGNVFNINYLIENNPLYRQSLIICLKAPCFNSKYNHQCFSLHRPKIVQYISDDDSYLWIQQNFGKFQKAGFYDWNLFALKNDGKDSVNKILDVKTNQLSESQQIQQVISVKKVKGRFIVQPKNVRKLQLHEICIDSVNLDQGSYKNASFSDTYREIERNSKEGVNCVYLQGVFQRDTEESMNVYKKPHASSMALTNRALPCQMLGGAEQFKALIDKTHKLGTKVIVDCTTRVSSSRMSKAYEHLRLFTLDQLGRKTYLYGSNGRSNTYEDTTVLNYRKSQAWDLFFAEIFQIIETYNIDGIYLDNAFELPQMFKLNQEELYRKQNKSKQNTYSDNQIFQGAVVVPTKITGYWASKISSKYPNPFFIKLCKNIWRKHPNFIIVAEGIEIHDNDFKIIKTIKSGPIPRVFKMPRALSQVVGVHLHSNGEISHIQSKTITHLKNWYLEINKSLPKNSIMIQSTTSPVWPNPSFIFKKATWAVVDLMFFLPDIPMTFGLESLGRAFRTKSTNINMLIAEPEKKDTLDYTKDRKFNSFKKANSTFFIEDSSIKLKRGNVSTMSNISLKDTSQIKYLQEAFRKEVGPQFGFDLAEIYKHYKHRRTLRRQNKLFSQGRLIPLSAEHMFGVHTNVLSFAKYDDKEMLLISINFNADPIDMHYNLTSLRALFRNYERSDLVGKLQDLLHENHFIEEYYTIGELLLSKIQSHIEPYKSSIWKLTIFKGEKLEEAFECSRKRMFQRINRNPPQWIYSSVFFNELNFLLEKSSKIGFSNGLNQLYNKFIIPDKLNFSLVMSKSYDFYIHKNKLQKLFGIFKLIQDDGILNSTLNEIIKQLLLGNRLGAIAFVTPEIGSWSSIGGLGVMVDELSKELAKLGEQVYIITPYYEYNKKKETGYLKRDGFQYDQNITTTASHFSYQFGIHRGKYHNVNFIWFHNPELFSKPYQGQGAFYVSKQLVFFALATLESFCQLKIFPAIIVTNDWMCGFVSAYVKCRKFGSVFDGSKFMHICHNLDPLYEGRLYPKVEEGDLNWLIQLPREWYIENRLNKLVINPSKCALQTCDNWSTVSNSYKYDLLKESPLAYVLWKYPQPFSFPNGIRKDQRLSIILTKTPGNHLDSKKLIQQKYFKLQELNNDVPLFAFIGRVTKQKGVHLILDAAQTLFYQTNFKIQIMVAGMADPKEDYGKYCADKMKYLTHKYPLCFWSDPQMFFTDGPVVNIGSDYAMMPSAFQPGGIVQHEFFCGGTPVIAFRTGGLKDTVFEYDPKTFKGNGFNFMSYELEDFKQCMRRAISCYKNKEAYEKLRENAFDSVVQEEDVARGWNTEFYRLQNKIYIDWDKVELSIQSFKVSKQCEQKPQNNKIQVLKYQGGQYWRKEWDDAIRFRDILKNSSRLKVKTYNFCFQTKKIPRPKEVFISGTWDDWKTQSKLFFDKIHKVYKISLKLKPGTYNYKYVADGEWQLTENQEKQTDINNIQNHVVVVE